jgi:hypothetical protein
MKRESIDWRKNGALIRERALRCFSEYARRKMSLPPGMTRPADYSAIVEVSADCLAGAFSDGDPSRLFFSYPDDLDWENENFNGRPTGRVPRLAATMATYFYDAWRTENQKCGIADYGHRREMKDDAARFIVEDYFSWRFESGVRPMFLWELGSKATDEELINIVRDLMNKAKERRFGACTSTLILQVQQPNS